VRWKSDRDLSRSNDRIARLGLTERQRRLNTLWAWYRAVNYDSRRIEWDGSMAVDELDREAIAAGSGSMYPDVAPDLPIRFRRPTAPYRLVRLVVNRFSGLLFSSRLHPVVSVPGRGAQERVLLELIKQSRLWSRMSHARRYGGACGTACVGFKFVRGRLVIEVHDPRWVTPRFKAGADQHTLERVEIRYIKQREERDGEGVLRPVDYWYRRTIDEVSDTLYDEVPVGDGDEPTWTIRARVDHSFGFCPVYWIQNLPCDDSADGDPDCHGIYEMAESIDALLSQANKGIISNCDPTLGLITDDQINTLAKGSDNAIRLQKGSSASYIEISGNGPRLALEMVKQIRAYALETAQCVVEHPDVANRTATEIERLYESMFDKVDDLREQYAEQGVRPLLEGILNAVRKLLTTVRVNADGSRYRRVLRLEIPDLDEGVTSQSFLAETFIGGPESYDGSVVLTWPPYSKPSLQDRSMAVTTARSARDGGLLTRERALRFAAPYLDVEDPEQALREVEEEAAAERLADDIAIMGATGAPPAETPPEEKALNGAQVKALMDLGIAIRNGSVTADSALATAMHAFHLGREEAMSILGLEDADGDEEIDEL